MISDHDKALIASSWQRVTPHKERAAELFLTRLFELKPNYRELYTKHLEQQELDIMEALSCVVEGMTWREAQWKDYVQEEEDLFLTLLALGRKFSVVHDVPNSAYAPAGQALLWMLRQLLGKAFTAETKSAWQRMYSLVSKTMQLGATVGDLTHTNPSRRQP